MPLGQRIARRWDVSTSVKNKYRRRDEQSSDRNLQIHGLGLCPCCGPHTREGLCPRARCSPAGDNVSDCSPPPSAPSPLPCTLYLWKVGDKGMERTKRRRRMESDPASSYPSCGQNINAKFYEREVKDLAEMCKGINCRLWKACRVITCVTRNMA